MKTLYIKNFRKEYSVDGKKVLLKAVLSDGTNEENLFYEFDYKYDEFICDDRIDGIVVNFFLTAMKFEYDVIKSSYPISEELYYNITYQIVPQFCEGNRHKPIKLDMPKISKKYDAKGVATGLSRGVDSFTSMYEYGKNFELESYRITHYTYFNAGAHHGQDLLVGNSKYSSLELYERQLEKTLEFCEKYNLELIVVDGNLPQVIRSPKLFGRWYFNRTHTYRNLGIAMLLQKGIGKYYYSAAHNLSQFAFRMEIDAASYEKWVIRHLGNENITFYNSNQEWSRVEKVRRIAELEESYDYLTVCLIDDENCGRCTKCRRTLMELDALGGNIIDRYAKSFDLETYKKEHRDEWWKDIWNLMQMKGDESEFFKETFEQAIKTNPKLLTAPVALSEEDDDCIVVCNGSGVNLRMLPSTSAKILGRTTRGQVFKYLGVWNNWYKIGLEDGREAYIYSTYAKKEKK